MYVMNYYDKYNFYINWTPELVKQHMNLDMIYDRFNHLIPWFSGFVYLTLENSQKI